MKIGVCGIGCEICPKMVKGVCPVGEMGCYPRRETPCKVCSCAFEKEIEHCFACAKFPCELTKESPIAFGFCQFIASRE